MPGYDENEDDDQDDELEDRDRAPLCCFGSRCLLAGEYHDQSECVPIIRAPRRPSGAPVLVRSWETDLDDELLGGEA